MRHSPTLRRLLACLPGLALAMGVAAGSAAAQATAPELAAAKGMLQARLRDNLPAGWQVRVSQRDQALVGFITPPTAEAFQVIYEPARQLELVRRLCPPMDEPIWAAIGAGSDIAIQPTVLGKTGLRTSCRALAASPPA